MVAQLSRRVLWSPEGQNPVTAYGTRAATPRRLDFRDSLYFQLTRCNKALCSLPYRWLILWCRVVFALFIISKSGGLIYNREFHTGMSKLTSNDYLMLAGSFHG